METKFQSKRVWWFNRLGRFITFGFLCFFGTSCGFFSGSISRYSRPANYYLYVSTDSGATVSFSIDYTTGILTQIGTTQSTGSLSNSLVVDPLNMALYVGDWADAVYGFTIDQHKGLLTPIASIAPLSVGPGTNHTFGLAIDPKSRFLYVTNFSAGAIPGYIINPNNFTLTSSSASAANTQTRGVGFDPTGQFAYAVSAGSVTLYEYRIDENVGTLNQIGSDSQANFNAMTVDPLGRYVYVSRGAGINTVIDYSIGATGILTQLGSISTGGSNPNSLAADPLGKYLYVSNSFSGDISAFKVDPSNGTLTSVGAKVFAGGGATQPISLTIDPSGTYLYATHYNLNGIFGYSIYRATGTLQSLGGAFSSVGAHPFGIKAIRIYQ